MKQPNLADLTTPLLPNLLVISVAVYGALLQSLDVDLYYLSIQEDESIEWATFWAFIGAGYLYLRTVFRTSASLAGAWCGFGLVAFCGFVALEEISWGQRIIGYRPPDYFLAFNYQQELNVHNVIDKDLRKLAVKVVIFGYGVALPLIGLIPRASTLMQRIRLLVPPVSLVPAFAVTGTLMIVYPFKFTGEWVELMLGLCFAFSALAALPRDPASHTRRPWRPSGQIALTALLIGALGVASATATRYQRDDNPQNVIAATRELEALRADFMRFGISHRCRAHKRLFTFAFQYHAPELFSGQFAQLTGQGLPEPRAAFLLDPWNYAYWIRDNCSTPERPRTTFLYSFGPNRRRDSTRWAIGGDDIAVFIRGQEIRLESGD
ncbi:MAG: hypothetical protein E2O52_10035 [Gammaproteobacteria bacterium]|nr:MAG: hypothetical protein E2O52_10035 [Gammaproteobacteria bacterium]